MPERREYGSARHTGLRRNTACPRTIWGTPGVEGEI